MAYGPKSKQRRARLSRHATRLAQSADYLGARDAATHARTMSKRERERHVLADVYVAALAVSP